MQEYDSDTDMSARSSSPAPSLYSFHPSIDERLVVRVLAYAGRSPATAWRLVQLRNVHGRRLNSQNETYMLPADIEEHQRLDLQHQIYTLMLGALYSAPDMVRTALRPRNDYRPAIFDVGTGSGSWALDMAREFPHCDVVGVDLAPIHVRGPLPDNVRFEIDDANLGFAHYRQSFDVIHSRAISGGIHDFKGLLREFADALRPDGILLLADGEMQLYDEFKQPLPALELGELGFSWTQRVFFAAYNAMKSRGGSIDSPTLSPRWLQEDGHFTEIGWNKIFVPIGPWDENASPREMQMADMLRSNCLTHINGMAPLLLSEGYFPETVEKMQREAAIELQSLRVHLYSRWNFAWAMKAA